MFLGSVVSGWRDSLLSPVREWHHHFSCCVAPKRSLYADLDARELRDEAPKEESFAVWANMTTLAMLDPCIAAAAVVAMSKLTRPRPPTLARTHPLVFTSPLTSAPTLVSCVRIPPRAQPSIVYHPANPRLPIPPLFVLTCPHSPVHRHTAKLTQLFPPHPRQRHNTRLSSLPPPQHKGFLWYYESGGGKLEVMWR